jgi:nitrite reductase/ring-hydroxylating ferredoxin subunit
MARWHDLGSVERFTLPVTPVAIGKARYAVTRLGGKFGVVSGVCNHAGGPLAEGRCEGEYLTCPWHGWKYHAITGKGEPGFEADAVPSHEVRVEGGNLLVDLDSATPRTKGKHPPHPLARRLERTPGAIRVVGISTTNMDTRNPLLDLRGAPRRGHGFRRKGAGRGDARHPARRAEIPGL